MRERFACRACETVNQAPAPFHVTPRGRAGPELLAMILEAKFAQHLPLNRQNETMPARVATECVLRGIAIGRKAWLFAGSDRGGERAAAISTLIVTAKLNGLDPRAWLADVLPPHRRTPGFAAR